MAKYTECNKCCGTGIVATCKHVLGGTCFSCNGTGRRRVCKRVAVENTYWWVACPAEGVDYSEHGTRFDTPEAAEAFADEVECMHLAEVVVRHKTYKSYKLVPA